MEEEKYKDDDDTNEKVMSMKARRRSMKRVGRRMIRKRRITQLMMWLKKVKKRMTGRRVEMTRRSIWTRRNMIKS